MKGSTTAFTVVALSILAIAVPTLIEIPKARARLEAVAKDEAKYQAGSSVFPTSAGHMFGMRSRLQKYWIFLPILWAEFSS